MGERVDTEKDWQQTKPHTHTYRKPDLLQNLFSNRMKQLTAELMKFP